MENSILHIISSVRTPNAMERLLKRCGEQDSIIFIQDGCYSLTAPDNIRKLLEHAVDVYAIAEDLTARNIDQPGKIVAKAIDYDSFVDLTLTHHNTISWK
jgi:tRNA 2-thiouridine synthesizing protein B